MGHWMHFGDKYLEINSIILKVKNKKKIIYKIKFLN